jgi:hypothetical protein
MVRVGVGVRVRVRVGVGVGVGVRVRRERLGYSFRRVVFCYLVLRTLSFLLF